MQKSRNTYIHIQQNIFALKALLIFTSSNCIFMQLQGNDILVNCQGNKFIQRTCLFTKSIIIRDKYILSRESYSIRGTYQFIQGNVSSFKENIFIQGNYIHSRKYIHLRNIYSFKFKAICTLKETIFTEHCCVRGHSRNIYSKIVPSHFMIIVSFTITIS